MVRDREAPGSNPGPPTNFVFNIKRFPVLSGVDGAQPGHRFAGISLRPGKFSAGGRALRALSSRSALFLGGYRGDRSTSGIKQRSDS